MSCHHPWAKRMKDMDLKKSLKQLERRLILVYVGSLFVLLGLSLFGTQVLKKQAASQATSFIRRMVKLGDFKETILTLSQAKLDYFDAVAYYDSQGTKVFSLPVDLDPKILNQSETANAFLYGYINTQLFFDKDGHTPLGTLVFAYGRYEYVLFPVGLWLLLFLSTLPLITSSRKAVVRRYEKELKIKSEFARADLARQVRHDIRSPLISLQGFLSSTENLRPSERHVLDRIVTRIFGIIADLEDTPVSALENNTTPVEEVIREVVREKQLQLKKPIKIDCRFEPSGFLSYTSMTRAQFSRIVSNILDNSFDAIDNGTAITISLRVALGSTIIRVADQGRGISPDILPRIFEKHFSHGKPRGSGIGLSSAKEAIETHAGKISAVSELGRGTTIEIELPVQNQPSWWMDKIETKSVSRIVVVDDQETAHDAWRMKLRGATECDHLKGEDELEKWMAVHTREGALFLLDFDLGVKNQSGIDLAKKFDIVKQAILVTGHFDDPQIRYECESLRLRLLPKPLVDSIAVV